MAHLTLMVQGREVRRFVLNPTVTTIGRAQDNDIVINNLALSRRHAEVHFRQGRYQVQDVGSQNGVFINSERIRGTRSLDPDDMITLGTYQFVFCDEASREPNVKRVRERAPPEVTQLEDIDPSLAAQISETAEEPMPLLVLKYNDVELQRFVLRDEPCLIGRGRDCDIQIAERRLSRRHCRIRKESGRAILEDLGSQNGTFVNRRRIPDRRELQHGDVLNFAEYSILFLANASDYDGPDSERQIARPPVVEPGLQREETDFAEAYASVAPSVVPASAPLVPSAKANVSKAAVVVAPSRRSESPKGDDPHAEPFVERPARAMERRREADDHDTGPTPPRRSGAESARPSRARIERAVPNRQHRNGRGGGVEVRPAPSHMANDPGRRNRGTGHRDVDDHKLELRPDRRLDDWYDQRDDSDVFDEEPSVLLERPKSSMSQLLSTMMVDKRELERNLAVRAKERRFMVEVSAQGRTSYAGPLKNPVTILGRDDEADIRLTGRYVAGRHSLLVRVRDSLLLVRLGSSSAARVNGLPKLQAFLKSGDVIQIDETTIRISEE